MAIHFDHTWHDFCDNCAEDLPETFELPAVLYDTFVIVCSPACYHRLNYVWNSKKKEWAIIAILKKCVGVV